MHDTWRIPPLARLARGRRRRRPAAGRPADAWRRRARGGAPAPRGGPSPRARPRARSRQPPRRRLGAGRTCRAPRRRARWVFRRRRRGRAGARTGGGGGGRRRRGPDGPPVGPRFFLRPPDRAPLSRAAAAAWSTAGPPDRPRSGAGAGAPGGAATARAVPTDGGRTSVPSWRVAGSSSTQVAWRGWSEGTPPPARRSTAYRGAMGLGDGGAAVEGLCRDLV